jgi:hypothetical protein
MACLSHTYKGYRIYHMGNNRWKATGKTIIWKGSLDAVKTEIRRLNK